MGSPRPIKARSFALENLERRLLLSGNFVWANAAGGDYNNGSNWVGGMAPGDGSNITIGALNPGAHVDFQGNTATLASVTISANGALIVQSGSLSVTQSLNIATGGSLSVTGSIRSTNGDGPDIASNASVNIGAGAVMNVNGGTVSIEHRTGAGGFFPVEADGTLSIFNGGTLNVSNGGTIALANGYLRDSGLVNVAADSSLQVSGSGYVDVFDIGVLNSAGASATSLSLANQGILNVNDGGSLTANAFTAGNTSSLQVQNTGSQATLNGVVTLNDSSNFTLEDDGLLSLAATGSLALHSYVQVNNYGGTLHLSGPTTSDGPTSYTGYGKLILGSNANPTGPPVDFGSSFTLGYTGSVEGWGTITAQTINLAGTISPGGTGQIGTLGFSSPGEINQQPETPLVFEFEVGATGADQVHFTSTGVYPGLLGFYSPEVGISYVAGFTPTAGFVGTTDPLVALTNIEVSTDNYGLPEYGLFGQVNTVFGDATHPGLDILTGVDASMSVRAAIADTGSTFTYIGPNQGSVSDPANWSGGNLPTFGSNVIIPTGVEAYIHSGVYEAFNTITVNGTLTSKTTHASVVLGGGDSTVNNLNFNNQEGAFLTVGANATLTVTGTAAFDSVGGLVVNGTVRLATNSTLANQSNQDQAVVINGTLAGTGTFEGNAYILGTLAPGGVSTVGTLTFTDDVQFSYSAVLSIRLADSNSGDQVVAFGSFEANGTPVHIQLLNPGITSYSVSIVVSSSDIGGNFGPVTVTGPGSSGASVNLSVNYAAQVTADLYVSAGGGGGSESTLSTTLRAGLPDLQAILREFGPYFNLGAINYAATGTTQPNLAVLPAALDSLFGISGLLASASLPTISATMDNNALVAALIGAGFTVDAIAGGATYNATVIPDVTAGSGLQIQVHYTASLFSNLTVSGSYSGNTLNDTTPNLLQGLASSLSLNGAITWTGSLGLSLVFGVDASGFFIAPSSALVLSAAGTGTVTGTGTIGGKSALSLTGTGAANLTVNLELGASGTPYRVTDLDGHLADKLVPLIAGTSSLSVNATVGPLSLAYTGNYTQTADLAAHTQTFALAGAVTGTLTIPGLKTAAGDPAALPVTGTFDSGSNSWTLTVSATDLRFSGLTVTSASFSITLSAATFAGSGAMNLQMTFFTSSATPITLALTASFDANTGTFGTDVVPPDVTVLNNQGGTLLTTTNVHLTATLTVDFGAGTLTGSMSLTAGGGTLTAFTLSNATHPTQPAVSLSYDFATQIIALSIDTLSVGLNHGFSLTVAGLTATYDRANNDPNQVLATVVNVTVKLGALNGPTTSGPPAGPDPSLTVSSLTLTQTGFSLSDTATVLDAHVGSFLSLNSAGVSLSGVGYDASGYHGAITLSATAGQLYTGQNLITGSVGATTGAFDLATQAFSLTASHLSLAAGSAFVISADGVALHYDPAAAGAQVFATLATATATSSQLSSMGSATLTGLQLATNGVSFGSFSFGQHAGDPNPVLGSILELVNPTVSVSNFSFTYGATSSASGTVGFAADSAKLYPAAGAALASSLTGVAGSYDFTSPGATGALNLSVASLSLTVANALTITASNVTLSPDATTTIATLATATVTSSTLAGLGSATISGFELNRTGFTIHTATLNQPPGSTATFGSVLSLTDASITVSELSYSTTATDPFSGMMSLGFGSAALFPNATGFLSTTLTDVNASFDLSGPSPTGNLNFTIGTFALRVGDAFVVTASNVTLTPAETTIATITSATLSSPTITGLPTAALSSLVITQNGFSVANFTLAQAGNATVTIGPALSLTGAALTVTGFAYDATNATNPVTGTVTLTITGASLFSNQSVFTTTLSGFSASFGFGGAAPHGALSITVGTFTLGIGEALHITASNVTLTPSASTLLTLATATVTSPTITNLASATLSNLVITQTGFSLGSFTLGQTGGSPARIGNVLSLTGASLVVTNLTYDTTHTASPITGTIALTVGSASLYPDATAFSTTLGNLVASYLLGGTDPTGRLSIAVGSFSLTLGEALRITASDLTLTPGAATIATIGTATLSSPIITGLASATLTSFVLTQTGFSLGSLTLAQTSAGTPARIGDFLSLTNASLQVTNFTYDSTNSAHPITGTVALSFGAVQLYPDSTAFTTILTGAAASYDFTQTGSLQITATTFELKIGEALDLTAGAITITPGQATLFTLATAAIASPQFPAFGTGAISNLVVTQTGFTLGSFTLGQSGGQTVDFGDVLRLTGATFTATNFAVSYGAGGTTFAGSIGLTATKVSLFPDSTLFTTAVTNFTMNYALGSGGDGSLHILAGNFTLQIGEALEISATNVEIAPGQSTMFTLATATLSSPQFAALGTGTITNLAVTQTGFTLGSFTLGQSGGQTVDFGTFLRLTGTTFTATNFAVAYSSSATTVSGTIGLAATGVALFPGSTLFTTTVSNFTTTYDFSPGGDGALHIHAGTFTLQIGEAVQVTASNVEIQPGQMTMFTLATATVSSPQFAALGTGTITDLAVTQTGFTLGSFSLGQNGGQTVDFGTFLRLTGATFTATNFAVTYGSTTTVSGTIGLTATGVALFPGSTLFTTTVTDFTTSYDFSPGGDGALHIHAGTFTLAIGQALQVSASDVEIQPGHATMFTLSNATVSSPQFAAFGSATVSDLAFMQTGFTLGSFTLGQSGGQTVNFGSVLRLTGATFTATNFAVTYGSSTTVSGTIGLAATGVALFPNSTIFTTTVANFTMDYALGSGGDGSLHIHAGTFTLRIGEALQVSATNVEIQPGESTMFTLASATVSSPQFADFGTGTITDLAVTQTGFTLGSFTLGQSGGQTVNFGGFLRLTGATFTATNFSVTYGSTTTVSGTIGLTATGLQLFPGSSFLTTTVTGLNASYDFSPGATGALSIHVDTFDLKIGEALDLSAGQVTITPGQAVMLTIGSALVTSPSLTGFGSVTLTDFVVRQDGFSFGHFTLGQSGGQTVDFGNVLELTGAVLLVDNFSLTITNNVTTISGTIGLTATGVTLFPGATFFTINLTGLSITYDLGSNAGTGALDISVTTFSLQISNALVISASNIVITPGRPTILTIGTATVTSPAISGISGSISGFTLTQSGFSIASLDLSPIPGNEVKFGNILTFTGITIGVRNFVYDSTHGTLAGTITVGAQSAVLFPGNSTFTATVTAITGGYTLGASGFGALSLSIGGLSLQLGTFLTFTGTNLVLTPEADTVLTVGSITATVTVGSITIGGTGSNFAITKSGGFQALTGFGVALDLNTDSSSFKWPTWLPIHITTLALQWPDISNHPLDFSITLSASVSSLNGLPVGVSGSISGLVIDLGELSRGNFPVTDIGSASITINGGLFGGQVSGSLVLGVVKIDAAGNQIAATDTTTAVAQRVLYGGIRASLSFAGISGFSISIGVSQLGPLSIYVSAGIPILLDPNSGLSITNFYAGVVFDQSLPSITDPKALRGSAFLPANQLTDAQWVAQLESSVVNQARAPPGSSWNVFSQTMLIEGGVTLFSAYTSTLVFHADLSIIISTDGKFLVSGSLVFGNSLTLKGSIYADLSQVRSGNATFLFLVDAPEQSPVLTIYGGVLFTYHRNDGTAVTDTNPADTFTIEFTGGVDFSAGGLVNASVDGTVDLSFGTDRFDLLLNGKVNLPLLGDALGVAGSFHLTTANGVKFWGALVVQPNFTALTQLGLTATGIAILRVNSTTGDLSETLTVPGQTDPSTYTLAAQSVSVLLQGTVAFSLGGADWFNVTGTWAMEITPTRLSVLGVGTLNVGPTGSPFLVYNYNGFFQIDSSGVAATLGVTQTGSFPGNVGLSLTATWQVTLNTTGHDVSFTLPPGTAAINGATSFTITGAPAAAPGDPTVYAAAPYLEMIASGDLNVLNSFTLHGTFFFLLSPGVLELTASATLALTAGSATILGFNVSGGIKIDATGAVAVLDLALNASVPIPANLGLSISGSFELQLNTTNAAQNIAGVALDAGSYVKVIAFNATLLELGVSLTGSFSFTSGVVNGLPTLQITADANLMLNVGGASGLTLFSFTVKGALLIDTDGIAAYFALTTGSGLGAGGTLGYQFLVGATLEINTTGKSHTFTTASGTATLTEGANNSTTPGNYAEVDLSGSLIVGGLTLSGDFFVAVTPTALTLYASATLALQLGGSTGANLFSFSVTGGMVINSSGLAGYVDLSAGATSSGSSAYSFSASATLEINTMKSGIDVATANGSRHLTSSANGVETADHAGTAYAQVWLHGSLTVSALFLSGDFYASVNSTSLTIYASATVKLQLGGSTGRSLYSFAVTGGLVITTSGLAGYVALATNVTSAGTSAYTFVANAVLEINSMGAAVDVATANGTQHLYAGANHSDASPGAYAQVWLHGSLTVGSLALTGEFYASVNATGLTIYANATLALQTGGTSGTTLFTFSVTGGLVITPTGLAGYVKLATGASSTGGVGYGFGADAVLEINTTGSGVTVPTADGPTYVYSGPNHVDVSPGVAYAQVWLHGSLTVGALVVTGEFYASVTATSLTVYANATLTLKVGGTSGATLFTLSAVGGMTITTSGLAAYVALGVTAGAGDANYSFANISATLVINTTNSHIQIGSGKTAKQIYAGVNHLDNPSGAYAEVDLNGSLGVAGLTITGDFFVGVTSTSLLVYASATLKLQVGGTSGATLFTFSVTGAMLLDQTGLAVYLAIGGGTNTNTTDYGFTITATLQINTTGSQHIFQLAGLPVTLYAGANNSTSAGVYAEVDLNGTLKVAGLTITGDFYASVTPTSLLLYASATLTLQLGGSTGATLFSFNVTGALLLDATGLAVYLNIGSGTNTNTTDYQFSINATLQLNTTLTQHTFQLAGLPVILYAGANNSTTGGVYAEVDLSGSLKVGSLAVTGDFFASVTPTSLLIYAIGTVTLKIGGNSGTTLFTLAVNGAMLLGPSGLAVYLSLSSGSTLNSQSALGYQFSIKATLQINTTLTQQTFQLSSGPVTLYAGANGSTTAAKYAEVDLNGSLTVDGLALTGDFYVGVSAFSLTVYAKATLTLKVGGANSATLLTLAMTGGLLINTRGLAAYLNVAEGVTATSNSSVLNYQFNVSATVLINTIGSNVSVGGTPVSGTAAGATAAGSYAQADLSGTLTVGGLTITGDFFVSVSFNSLQIYADATLLLKAAGTTVLSIDFTGAMLINSLGIAAFIDLTAGTPVSSTSGLNYAFSVTATFKLNTTGAPVALDGTTLKSGNYAQVVLSGTLVAYGLTLDGTFTVTAGTVNGVATLEISANAGLTLQAGSTTIFTLTVIGAMRITTGGIAAWINLTTGSNTANSAAGLNYSFTATAIFQLNTTGAAQTVGGQTLDAGRFARVVLTGDLTVLGLTIHGGFTLTAGTYNGATSIDIAAAATLDLKAGGVSVLTLGVTGAMRITAAGIAASITVDVSGGAPSGLGFAFNVTGVLQINTTSTTQTFTVPFGRFFVTATLPAGPYAQAYLSGTLTVLGLTISANFTITADLYNGAPSLTVVLGSASVVLQAGSTAMFTFSTSGGLRITSDGIAAYLNVSLTAGPPSGLGFTFGATLTGTLQINTTSSAQVFTYFIGNRLFFNSLAAGPYAQISISATLSLGVLQLGGTFTLTAGVHNGVATVQLGVTATLNVNIGSLTIFTFSVSGNMRITSGGIAAALSLTLTSGVPSGLGFSLSPLAYTNFLLIVNTTSSLQNLDSQTTVPPGPYVYLAGQAVLVVGGFNVTGQFNLTVSSSGISVFASAQVSIFGVTGSVSGTFGIYADGVVLGLTVTLPTISTYFFSLSGTLSLQLNSTNRTVNGIQGQTYQVAVTNARLSLLGFTLSGSLTIGVINGYFFITVPSTAPLTVSVLGLATVSLSGSLRSDGTFSLSGSVSLGSGGVAALGDINVAALVGSMTVTLSSSHGFYGAFNGDLYLFGQDVGHVAANTTISATPFTYSIPTYTYYSIFSDPVDYARYPHGKVTGSIDFANSYLVVQATGAFNLSRFGLDLSLNGSATLAIGPAGLSGIFDISGKLFGVSTSAHFYLDAASHYWIATASLSVNLGDNNFGLSASASATISSDSSQDSLSLSGSAWAQYDGIGASATFTASANRGDLSGNLSFTVNMTFIVTVGIGFNVSLEGGFKLTGSDLAGGYAFLDTTGNGVWDASMPRTPVDADGNFNFAVGDPTQWVVDTAGGYAFRDLNGNGTWDQTTEAYVPLKADGSLPDAIAQLLDPTANLGAGATDAASVLGLLRQYAVQDAQGLPTGALNLALGHVKAIGGNVVKTDGSAGAANTAVIDLGGRAAGYTGLIGAGQTVFFDTNGNGVLDAGEVSVTASNTGFFTFAPNLPHTRTLGLLAGFDTNGNGLIDPAEGSIVVTGAHDKNNGVATALIFRIAASNLNGLSTAANPLATLRTAMVGLGSTGPQADARLSYAFNLSTALDFSTFVPSNPTTSAADRSAVLLATAQVETLLLNVASLLSAASHGTLTAAAAQQLAINQLALTLLSSALTPPAGNPIQTGPALDLTDVALISAFFNTVATTANLALDPAVLNAAARITAALNLAAAGYAAAGGDPTRQLARIDALVEGQLGAALGDLAAGTLAPATALTLYTGGNLTNLLNAVVLTPIVAPTVATPDDISVQGGTAIAPIVLDITSATTLQSHLVVTATSSNQQLLPDAGVVVGLSGDHHVLFLQPAAGQAGTTIITLTVSDGSLVTTRSFRVTVTGELISAPVITSTPVTTALIGQTYTYGVTVSSADPTRTFVITAAQPLPAWLTLTDNGDGTATLSGIPPAGLLGVGGLALQAIALKATDDRGSTVQQGFTVVVTAQPLDSIQLTGDSPADATVGTPFNLHFTATTDDSAGPLVFSLPGGLPAWLHLADNGDGTATLSGTPMFADTGALALTLVVTDANGQVAARSVAFNVTSAQGISALGDLTQPANSTRTIGFTLTGVDAGTQLTVASNNPGLIDPSGLILGGAGSTRTLTLIPLNGTSGNATITLTLLENGVVTATRTFQLTVTSIAPPIAPVIAPVGNVTLTENSNGTITLTLGGIDLSAQLSATSDNSALIDYTGLLLSGTGFTRTLKLTPKTDATGNATITLTLSDGGLVTSLSFQLTVTPVDHPVTLLFALPSFVVSPGSGNITVDLSHYFSNTDGTTTYALGRNTDAALLGARIDGNQLILTPAAARAGLAALDIIATSKGAGTGQTYTVTGTVHVAVLPDVLLSGPSYLRLADGSIVARFTVALSVVSNQAVRVAYGTSDGTARSGIDYTGAQGYVDIAAGALSATIDIRIAGTSLYPNLDFTLALNSALSALLQDRTNAQVDIPVDRVALFSQQGGATIGFGLVVSFLTSPGSDSLNYPAAITGVNVVVEKFTPAMTAGANTLIGSDFSIVAETSLSSLATPHRMKGYGRF